MNADKHEQDWKEKKNLYHENTKLGKKEKEKTFFVFSCFRALVILYFFCGVGAMAVTRREHE